MFVLVLDDNLLSSASLRNQLERAGHRVVVVRDPEQLPRAARGVDAIVVNLMVRGFDPLVAIRQLRPALRGARWIGFCGHRDVTRRSEALAAGCDHVITNAQALRQLNETLAELNVVGD